MWKHILFQPFLSSYKHIHTASLASPQVSESVSTGTRHLGLPQWCHTLAARLFPPSLFVAHFSIFPLFVFYDDDNVSFCCCYSSLLPSTLPCLQANMKMSSLSPSFAASPSCFRSLPLSLPDVKSTVIRLLVNLWWPRHLTVELHQQLKNTEQMRV